MDTEKKLAGKAYQAPSMVSVDLKMHHALMVGSSVNNCTCNIGVGFGGGSCTDNSGGGRSRGFISDDEE